MSRTRKTKTYLGILGQNDSSAPDTLTDYEARLLQNVELSTKGALVMREGTELYRDVIANKPIDNIIEYRKQNGTVHLLYATDGKLLNQAGTQVATGLITANISSCVYQDILYIVDGTNYYQYDGTTFKVVVANTGEGSDLAPVKRCKYIFPRGDRIFFAGDSQNPNFLYYSELLKPDYVKALNVVKALTDDDDIITALVSYRGAMLVFKRKRVFAWFGHNILQDVSFKEVDSQSGAVSHRAILKVEDKLIYMGMDGIYALGGLYPELISSSKVSRAVQNTFNKFTNHAKAFAVLYKDKAMFWGDTASGVQGLVMHTNIATAESKEASPYSVYTNLDLSSAKVLFDGTLLLGTKDGKALKSNPLKYSDRGVRIPVRVLTKYYDMDTPFIMKKIKRVYLAVQQNKELHTDMDVMLYVGADYKPFKSYLDVSLVYGEGNWSGGAWGWSDIAHGSIGANMKGTRAYMDIKNFDEDLPWVYYGCMFEYKEKRPERFKSSAVPLP